MLVQHLVSQGFSLKKKTSNEWSTSCPRCGGSDRLQIWEVDKGFSTSPGRGEGGRYWCRKCGISGDYYSWLIDVEGRSPAEVLPKDGRVRTPIPLQERKAPEGFDMEQFRRFSKVAAWAAYRHAQDADAVAFYKSRGLTPDTVEHCGFGWIPRDVFIPASQTGRTNGKMTCLPRGACFPICGDTGDVDALLVRRADETEWDRWGKWAQVGSRDASFLLGIDGQVKGRSLVICESVLDAASVYQARGGLVASMALLGASKRPTGKALDWIDTASKILVCADGDEGGESLCKTILEMRDDALVWRPIGAGVKDINDLLVKHGDAETALFLDMGFAQLIKDDEAF